MKTVWDRQIRPAIFTCSVILFVLFTLGHDSSGNRRADRPYFLQLKPNLRTESQLSRLGNADAFRVRDQGSQGRSIFRNLLAVGEGVGAEAKSAVIRRATPQATALPGVDANQTDESSRNESLPIPVEEGTVASECENVRQHPNYPDSCSYVKSIPQCSSGTLVEYTQFFFCAYKGFPLVAYVLLGFWLVALFYMLGNTAADFFCCSLEKLSKLLHLPPTVSGVTLLPLGNGAPDVFASVAAFVGAGQGQVGLNSVLGGAAFVSSVVAGSASLVVASSGARVHLDRHCFMRDIGFFLFTLGLLSSILYIGEIHLWGAIGFTSIYGAYAITVATVELLKSHGHKLTQWQALQPLLPGKPSSYVSDDEYGLDEDPHHEFVDIRRGFPSAVETSLPQWMLPHVAIYSQQSNLATQIQHMERQTSLGHRPLWGSHEEGMVAEVRWYSFKGLCSYLLEWPLTLPRRLTIPIVEEKRWSKFYAVCSATLSPALLAMVWDGKDSGPIGSAWKEYIIAGAVGLVLGGISLFSLSRDHPPRKYLFPWAAGGFVMSIVWFYIIANELVGALVALGVILEIDPAILGLTVLAWGNSIGDLVSNLALVYPGGDGVQIAFSGCYAGPMFNTLIGIGLSFVLASWKTFPAAFVIPQDDGIFLTLAFLVAGLVWALCFLPSRGMQPTKGLGVGLLCIYLFFLTSRVVHTLGLSPFFSPN